jgi:gluconolactonase
MRCEGNVWVTAPGGLWVYSPAGKLIGKVSIPELPANLHWGGEDWRTLYVRASTSVYSVPVKIGPRNEPFMRARNRPSSSPRHACQMAMTPSGSMPSAAR